MSRGSGRGVGAGVGEGEGEAVGSGVAMGGTAAVDELGAAVPRDDAHPDPAIQRRATRTKRREAGMFDVSSGRRGRGYYAFSAISAMCCRVLRVTLAAIRHALSLPAAEPLSCPSRAFSALLSSCR